ncbi:MAG: hypothetical protein AAB875_05145 [Patescibacteria group bacterium]
MSRGLETTVVEILKAHPAPLAQNRLAKLADVSISSISHKLRIMEAKGLISRSRVREGKTQVNYVQLEATSSSKHSVFSSPRKEEGMNSPRQQLQVERQVELKLSYVEFIAFCTAHRGENKVYSRMIRLCEESKRRHWRSTVRDVFDILQEMKK